MTLASLQLWWIPSFTLWGTWGNETKGVTLTKKRPTLTKLNRLVSLTTYLL